MSETKKAELAAVDKAELVKLGDPGVWIKRTPQGQIRSVKARLALREDHNELVEVERKLTISAKGYYRANQIASLAILTPDNIKIPGSDGLVHDVPNPFPIIDKESGTQKGVWVKKMVVGYSPIGSMAVSSTTMYYDFSIYFLEDLQRKVMFNKDAGRLCFEDQLTDEEKKNGIFMRIEGTFGVWANTQHPDVLKAIRTWVQTKKFGDRKAQTVAERNALKHHPALALQLYNINGTEGNRWGNVNVIGWQHDHDYQELEEIALAADAGEHVEINGQVVEVIDASSQMDETDVRASDEGDFDDAPTNNEVPEEPREGLF